MVNSKSDRPLAIHLTSNDHLRFTIYYSLLLGPLECAFAPGVVVTNDQDGDENKHLEQGKFGEREIVAHENNRPGQKKDRLDIKDQKQHRDDVITHRKSIMCFSHRIDTTLVRAHLLLFVIDGP